MAKGGELGCRAHLGRLGRDFSPEPLLRYSFIEIECPIWDFCVEGKKEGGQKTVQVSDSDAQRAPLE